jgi:hypothetical protein
MYIYIYIYIYIYVCVYIALPGPKPDPEGGTQQYEVGPRGGVAVHHVSRNIFNLMYQVASYLKGAVYAAI